MQDYHIKNIVEAALLASDRPLTLEQIAAIFGDQSLTNQQIREIIKSIQEDYNGRGIMIAEVASGFRVQVRPTMMPWVSRLWEERSPRYSRALLETLALVAYRQPITRGEIEEIRGVSVSTNIIRTLTERGWARVVGHRDVPGRPAMYGTTREFLDYFGLQRLEQLPPLSEILEGFTGELDLGLGDSESAASDEAVSDATPASEEASAESAEEEGARDSEADPAERVPSTLEADDTGQSAEATFEDSPESSEDADGSEDEWADATIADLADEPSDGLPAAGAAVPDVPEVEPDTSSETPSDESILESDEAVAEADEDHVEFAAALIDIDDEAFIEEENAAFVEEELVDFQEDQAAYRHDDLPGDADLQTAADDEPPADSDVPDAKADSAEEAVEEEEDAAPYAASGVVVPLKRPE